VIYGANGLGGVVDVIPQSGVTGSFIKGSAEFGSDDRRLLRASGGGGNGNISFSLSGQHQQADDYSLSDDYAPQLNQPAGARVNSDFKRDNVLFQFDAKETPLGHASMFINLSEADKGLPPQAGVDDPNYERLTKNSRRTVGLSNHFKKIPLSIKLYYNGFDSELRVYSDDSYTEVDEIEAAEDYSWGGKLYSSFDTSDRNALVLSASVQADSFKAEGALEGTDKAELTSYTLAAEDEFWINDRLSLAAGVIYTYFDQTLLDKTSDAFNPQAAIGWQFSPAVRLHASAAQRTRFPKMRELYRRRYGNPDLEPQTANNYEVGFSWQHASGLGGDLALYRSDVDDLIERTDRRSSYQNLDRVTFQGIETAAGGWITDKVFGRLAYTYVQADEELPDGDSRQLRSRPKHTAVAEFRYRFPRDILFSFNGVYVAGLYDLDPDDVYVRLPAYFLANIRASVPFAEHYEAHFSVSNLLDSDYQHRWGFPREGRAVTLGLALAF